MTVSSSCPGDDQLTQLLQDALDPPEQARLSAHLDRCEPCQSRLETLAAGGESWHALHRLRQAQPPAPTNSALRQVVERLEGDTPTSDPSTPRAPFATEGLNFLEPARQPGHLGRLGHYAILEVVGRGGMGIVLRAFDEKLHRTVAVKVLAPYLAGSSVARERFAREARAAAAVVHEHVVAIHAVEDTAPIPYLVMQYVGGMSLQQRIEEGGPLEVQEVVRIGMEVAEGLAAAHKQGLVHRDIKPANILLESGQRVKLTDFGLARAADDASLTQSGVVAGTPQYMAPEQARGETVDHRADLFSLGSVLYTLCTGQPPFRAGSALAILKRVCEEHPQPVRTINASVPEWLAEVIARLHAKAPEQRFQSATEVAELLRQSAPPPSPPRQQGHPCSRVGLGSRRLALAAALLVVIGGALAAYLSFRTTTSGDDTPQGKTAPGQPLVPRQDMKAAELARLPSPLDSLRRETIPANLLALAGSGNPKKAPAELVAVLADPRLMLPDPGAAAWPAQSRDGKLLAVPCGTSIALFDASTGSALRSLRGHSDPLFRVVFRPDGKQLAATSWMPDRTITLWNLTTGKPARTLRGHAATVVSLAYHPDGKRLASSSDDGSARVWDLDTGEQVVLVGGHNGHVWTVAFSPDGKRLFTGGKDGVLKLRDASNGEELKEAKAHTDGVSILAFSPNGKLLASGNDREAKLWDAETLELVARLDRPAAWLAFTPDGQTLLTARHDHQRGTTHTVYRWDVATHKPLADLPLQSSGGFAVYHLSPDGKTLYSMRSRPPEPWLSAYSAATGERLLPPQGHAGPVYTVAVHPDGRTIASGGVDQRVVLWDPVGATKPRILKHHQEPVRSVAFSPDGQRLASGAHDGTIGLWEPATGKLARTLTGHTRGLSLLTFSPDSRTVAAGGDRGEVHFWDAATGTAAPPLKPHVGQPRAVAYSPDGKQIASAGYDGMVKVNEVGTGRLLHTFPTRRTTNGVAFSADGRYLAAVGDGPNASLFVWELRTGAEEVRSWSLYTRDEEQQRRVISHFVTLAIHPGGHLAATGASDGTLWLWDLTPGSRRFRVIGPGPFGYTPVQVAFTSEGRYLLTANTNGSIYVLRLAGRGRIPGVGR
ncbi:MAG: protein kinase [Gemmataceae bacterium]|nr:protein kinase [Gemmataceae bacterium]